MPLLLLTAAILCLFSTGICAQAPKKTSLPQVATIKDYPATGLMTGCGNFYFYQAADTKKSAANYLFISRGDGSDAWMNLNGRDVRLQEIKPRGQAHKPGPSLYRYGKLLIRIAMAKGKTSADGEHNYTLTITLQNGAVRTVRGLGSSDC